MYSLSAAPFSTSFKTSIPIPRDARAASSRSFTVRVAVSCPSHHPLRSRRDPQRYLPAVALAFYLPQSRYSESASIQYLCAAIALRKLTLRGRNMTPFYDDQLDLTNPFSINNYYGYPLDIMSNMNAQGVNGVNPRHVVNNVGNNAAVAANNTSDGSLTFMDALEMQGHSTGDLNTSEPPELQDCGALQGPDNFNVNVNDEIVPAAIIDAQDVHGGSELVEDESYVKVEAEDLGNSAVSLTPSYGGEHDEYDEYDESDESGRGSIVRSRAIIIPKTNKDGVRRKSRQPRAKLLKWTDNDWKNVVLGIIWACGETGTQIPFDQAAQIVGESCTAGALQQAVLKLRQKQLAEGNWIPSLRMAWTRKSKNSETSVFNANDTKESEDNIKSKTMLVKRKQSIFKGTQSLMVTLKRAYREADREHIDHPHKFSKKIKEVAKFFGFRKDIEEEATKSLMFDQGMEDTQTPIQKRRTNLHVSATGSPHRVHDFPALLIDTKKTRGMNRKALVHNGTLYQQFAYSNNTYSPSMSTPGLTNSSGFHSALGTPLTVASADQDYLTVSAGPIFFGTPSNTEAGDMAAAQHLQSAGLNPQGLQQYDTYATTVPPTSVGNDTYKSMFSFAEGQARQNAASKSARGDDVFN
ncbi:hypothetical protein T440DRAFT_515016 [Plenodomus tracheiphilus IPT5]|uniref:Uncharacterized protein n=1 Tax=Plenodomus tracheiphilus IPT5 TaxID=1408161 RepID=A0A6A7BFW0_9PLEO|nr:hypothetical protein T440DRAFT_515016 [Plenodomus tracheiphilus IPT5]